MYHCSHCDAQFLKWQGRCSECGKWGTLNQEEKQLTTTSTKKEAPAAPLLDLANAKKTKATHVSTKNEELDRVLSGGVVPGSVTLLAGQPGIGKSTLVAQVSGSMEGVTLYISGEESEGQVLMRLERLGIDPKGIKFSNTVQVGSVITAAKKLKPTLLIIDSIQTMIPEEATGVPGTPNAVRASTAQLIGLAKSTNIPVLLIGQITKEGSVAGPKTLEHLVDTVLTIEGDRLSPYRLLRASKNRFGSTDEVGIFEMNENGMQSVQNPSARFLEERSPTPGSVVTCIMEGSRPILVEVQALAEKSHFANPIRRTSGFDTGRLQMLLAIIGKRAGVKASNHDVYVNVIGGIKVKENAADLAVCAAIISSIKDKAVPTDAVYVGELGLGGEVRTVPFLEKRIKEAERLGLKQVFSPKTVKTLKDLM